MRRTFVKTSNALRYLEAVAALTDRGASEACLMVVDGEPGQGKTTAIQWWAVNTGSVYLRAKKEWTPRWALREMLTELRLAPEYSFERMYRQALEALGQRAEAAERDGQTFGVVIDEVDHISRNARLLETFRDLSDMLEIPFVLVGMGRVRHNLTRFPQVASRVGQYVEFKPSTVDDVRLLIEQLCEVPVQPDLIDYVARVSEGKAREIKEAIASIERFGRRGDGEAVGLADMDGQVLMNDRRTGRPIYVRA